MRSLTQRALISHFLIPKFCDGIVIVGNKESLHILSVLMMTILSFNQVKGTVGDWKMELEACKETQKGRGVILVLEAHWCTLIKECSSLGCQDFGVKYS